MKRPRRNAIEQRIADTPQYPDDAVAEGKRRQQRGVAFQNERARALRACVQCIRLINLRVIAGARKVSAHWRATAISANARSKLLPVQETLETPTRRLAAARVPRTGFFWLERTAFGAGSGSAETPDCRSIHSSSRDFLKRQRLPSLKAGMNASEAYLYSVSGLMPR